MFFINFEIKFKVVLELNFYHLFFIIFDIKFKVVLELGFFGCYKCNSEVFLFILSELLKISAYLQIYLRKPFLEYQLLSTVTYCLFTHIVSTEKMLKIREEPNVLTIMVFF